MILIAQTYLWKIATILFKNKNKKNDMLYKI
jgi:hypothetical protein